MGRGANHAQHLGGVHHLTSAAAAAGGTSAGGGGGGATAAAADAAHCEGVAADAGAEVATVIHRPASSWQADIDRKAQLHSPDTQGHTIPRVNQQGTVH